MGSLSKPVLGGSIHRIREFELEKVGANDDNTERAYPLDQTEINVDRNAG